MSVATRRARHLVPVVGAITLAAVALAGCDSGSSAGGSSSGGSATKLSLIGYSVPKPCYDALAAAFEKTGAGQDVSFAASYGASGAQSRAVANGQKADYVAFSTGPDMTRLVPSKVDASWNAGPTKGIVADTVVVIAVRPGNPKGIKGWDDLIKPGIGIVTPDPGSSGSAKWNILAAYHHELAAGGTAGDATAFLKKFYANIVSKPASGSSATSTFLNGTGDVLISYEAEAITTRAKGQKLDYIVPADTVLIETPAAVTKTAPPAAKAFLAYAESADGQKIFGSKGFRPIGGGSPGSVPGANDPADPYPTIAKLTTIAELGGWSDVNSKFFDPDKGLVTEIAKGSG